MGAPNKGPADSSGSFDSQPEGTDSEDGLAGTSPSESFLRKALWAPASAPPSAPVGLPPEALGGRFVIRRCLGAGGFGVVHEAFDQVRGATVAIKVLQARDAGALYRFKQEFRALADVAHPNLVTLFELFSEDPLWFYTMELVRGRSLIGHLRPEGRAEGPLTPRREEALCAVMLQLGEGLLHLHGAGILHRDLKPQNVLCTGEGRVVILDFGLAREEAGDATTQIAGTPAYMSPEQADGGALGPATDWYGVGVMLYEALTGRRPFQGTPLQVLRQKAEREPPPPASEVPGLAADWDRLCADLLRRDPRARPDGPEVRRRLLEIQARLAGERPAGQPTSAPPTPAAAEAVGLVGREAQLALLQAGYDAAAQGRTAVALCHGAPGMGKTALCRHFMRRLPQALVLPGRCYEHEQVPFKALDSAVDALSRHLRRLPAEQVAAILPRDIAMLRQVFPVLSQVPAVQQARGRSIEDPQERKRAAVRALRELFQRLGDTQPVVVFVDDLQWGDLDSAALLLELLRAPDAPALLLLASYRSEDGGSEVVAALREALGGELYRGVEVLDVAVPALAADEAQALLAALWGPAGDGAPVPAGLVDEAGGSPLFLRTLLADARERPSAKQERLTLEGTIRRRVERLPAEARALLEVVCVAGHPLLRDGAARALVDPGTEPAGLLALAPLRAGRLLRTRSTRDGEELIPYHDRIREAVATGLSAEERRGLHLRLAQALAVGPAVDPQRVMHHYLEAGERAQATPFALQAVATALAALAFGQAAELCQLALGLPGLCAEQERALRATLADALAGAGRPHAAAQAYLRAAAAAPLEEAIGHRRRAMWLLLISGHVDEGIRLLLDLCAEVGLPRPPGRALTLLLFLIFYYVWLPLRGSGGRERAEHELGSAELRRLDTCLGAFEGLSLSWAHSRHLGPWFAVLSRALALRAGEPGRLACTLAPHGLYWSCRGQLARGDQLLRRAGELAERSGSDHALATVARMAGYLHLQLGRWAEARSEFEKMDTHYKRCPQSIWAHFTFRYFDCMLLWCQGEVRPFAGVAAALLKESRELGHHYHADTTQAYFSGIRVLADEPEAALAMIRGVKERSPGQIDYIATLEPPVLVYCGRLSEARELARRYWADFSAVGGLLYPRLRVVLRYVQAQAAIGLFCRGEGDARLLHAAARHARAIRREPGPLAPALATVVSASLRRLRGDREGALRLSAEAEERFTRAGMALHACAVRRRRAGWTGEATEAAADGGWMEEQGIRSPDRMTDMLVPA